MLEIGVSVLRRKIKIPQNQRFHGIFDGRSDWIRTSGHLNPIQVLYQTEPHPVIAAIRLFARSAASGRNFAFPAVAFLSRKTHFVGALRESFALRAFHDIFIL